MANVPFLTGTVPGRWSSNSDRVGLISVSARFRLFSESDRFGGDFGMPSEFALFGWVWGRRVAAPGGNGFLMVGVTPYVG